MKLEIILNAINHSKKRLLDTDDEFVEKQYVFMSLQMSFIFQTRYFMRTK